MTAVMCVRLNCWPIDQIARRRPSGWRDRGVVLVDVMRDRQIVAVACPIARSSGIRSGMTLAEARALRPSLVDAPHRADVARRGLEALARWMTRFSPVVAVEPPDALFLDVRGCERLWGGLEPLLQRVASMLVGHRIGARLAIAPTAGAAWACASFGARRQIAGNDDLRSVLEPLPPEALRLDPAMTATLRTLGILTIGQLMALKREALPSRFGPELLLRLDQALGRVPEPLVPLHPEEPIQARLDFEETVDSLEVLWQAFERLLGEVVIDLARRGTGARKLRVQFMRYRADPVVKEIRLSRPSRNAIHLFKLIRYAAESAHSDDGFTGIILNVPIHERVSDEQERLVDDAADTARRDLADLASLVERLQARLGDEAVHSVELVDSHLPERAYRWIPPDLSTHTSGTRKSIPADFHDLDRSRPPMALPLHLMAEPVEVPVTVGPSHDGDGPPLSFRDQQGVHRLRHVRGPDRIAGLWWDGHDKTRDYFDAEDESGRRFWLFRVASTGRWYLHGLFL